MPRFSFQLLCASLLATNEVNHANEHVRLHQFARIRESVADHLKDSFANGITAKRVFNLDEAAEYCGLTRDSFKKKVVRDPLRKVRLDKCWRFDKADLDEWIESHKEQVAQETAA